MVIQMYFLGEVTSKFLCDLSRDSFKRIKVVRRPIKIRKKEYERLITTVLV